MAIPALRPIADQHALDDDYACGCAYGACDCYHGPDGPPDREEDW